LEDLAAPSFTLKREAARPTITPVLYCNTTWHHNTEDLNTNLHCHENIKSHIGENCVRCSKLKKKLKYSLRVK